MAKQTKDTTSPKPKETGKELTPGPGTRYYEKRNGLGEEGKK